MSTSTPARTLSDLPGPTGLPVVGNLLQLDLNRMHRALSEWSDEFGTLYKIQMGSKPVLVVADADLIQQILKQRPQRYRRLAKVETVFREMGIHGVFSAEGDDWQRQRKLTARALDKTHLKAFFPVLRKVTERLRCRWERAADNGSVVDVQSDLMRYTVDVTTNLAFGHDLNSLEDEGGAIQEHLERIFPTMHRRINAPFAYWHYVRLPADRAFETAKHAIHEFVSSVVEETKARLIREPELAETPGNFLEAMLVASEEEEAESTDEEIFGNVITMLLAGEDTTANSLAWMIDYLSDLPPMQTQLQAEADEKIDRSGLTNTAEELDGMNFAEAAALEAMRLKPVAPLLFMEPNEDVELHGVRIPRGTAMMLVTIHPCLQDDHFGYAAEFRPQRWLADKDPAHAGCPHNAKAFVPFGAGPRFCPGRGLAMLEIKAVAAMLGRCFEVTKVKDRGPVRERFAFTLMPENLFVRFERRQ